MIFRKFLEKKLNIHNPAKVSINKEKRENMSPEFRSIYFCSVENKR